MIRRLLDALRHRPARGGHVGPHPGSSSIPLTPSECVVYDPATREFIHWVDGEGATRIPSTNLLNEGDDL